MHPVKLRAGALFLFVTVLSVRIMAQPAAIVNNKAQKTITISNQKMTMVIDYNKKLSIVSMVLNGQQVISGAGGIYTAVNMRGQVFSSLEIKSIPVITRDNNGLTIGGIIYGDKNAMVHEKWNFVISNQSIKWNIERGVSKTVQVQEAAVPVFNFSNMQVWEGAYQGYGGLAWFYLFNEKLCAYGVHSSASRFWNSKTGNGLTVMVDAPGKQVAMKYSRTNEDKLAYTVTVSDKEMMPRLDSGTQRRRFVRGSMDVWAPFNMAAGKTSQTITLSYFDYNKAYGRGKFNGVDGSQVSGVLNTIARIGVIDALHFGGNSWHTPYGPICLHEQYIAQLGLAINDPNYLKGYQNCLDFYRDHAIKPDGRVFSRWAYTNEDMMPGQVNEYGFYEARWGILMDANPDLVVNVSELYDQTGDKVWVKKHQLSCEKALDWILRKDSNQNGLVEMMNTDQRQQMSSDWIDIVWASYENAFVNAKLYYALIKWAAIERQLNNGLKATYYQIFAARLKTSFNRPIADGGFWDAANNCYVHWHDKDNTPHGRNMVTPVNFMAIAYGICDDNDRKKMILDTIEAQMQRERLFFWPLTMKSYAPGEAKDEQFPFPAYENGDIFLSWGAVAVQAYSGYKPAIAIQYIKNVLGQYGKDGLAFQRYGRLKQDGLGDDILSGNSLSIAGLYQFIYGINPLYNRFYLDPHITPELAGTEMTYNFRGKQLTITLDSSRYTLSDKKFTVSCRKDFGFYTAGNQMSYFDGNNAAPCLQVTSASPLAIAMLQCAPEKMAWVQTAAPGTAKMLDYQLHGLKPNADYAFSVNAGPEKKLRSSVNGDVVIKLVMTSVSETIILRAKE